MWVPCRPRLREYVDDSSSVEWCRASVSGRTSTRWPARSTSREPSGTPAGASSRRWRGPRRILSRSPDVSATTLLLSRSSPASSAEDVPTLGGTEFTIRESETAAGRTFVSPDVTICDDCLAELRDPGNRRHAHPFITCTNCGPRYTITTGLPYDRPATTMAGFPMCAACATEYADPADRRFHAQTVCCPACGPRLRLVAPGRATSYGDDALAEARSLLATGAVVAVKGIGGYHLACDATDEAAVAMLRKRKQRGDKPFAVMVASLDDARGVAELTSAGADARREPGPPDRARRPETGRGRRRGGPRPGRPGRAAGLRAAAPPVARPARAAGAGDDQRQPVGRADRRRGRACAGPPGRTGGRLADPRPPDPRAVRRLGDTCGRRGRGTGAPVARSRTAADRPALRRPALAGRRRRREEHLLPRRGTARLDVRAHRRHGRPRHPGGVRRRGPAPVDADRRRAGGGRGRPPPGVPLPPLGRGPLRRRGRRAAPPRARRVDDGRARPARTAGR